MDKLRILVAHSQPAIVCAAARILEAYGFGVDRLSDGDQVAAALDAGSWDGLVVDTSLPGMPVHDLCALAKEGEHPVPAVILIAAIFRRGSYKRRPGNLYGADDVVEVHRIAEDLPTKLWRLFARKEVAAAALAEAEMAYWSLHDDPPGPEGLADLLVAGAVLDRAAEVVDAESPEALRDLLTLELEAARNLIVSVTGGHDHDAAVERAYRALCQPQG